jgi:hypothetical protein
MAENNANERQRRANFRLRFPPSHSPRIYIGGIAYSIVDISEKGVRFNNPLRHRMPDDLFPAFIWLHEGEPIKVLARLIRIEPRAIALYFVQGIPYKRIVAEQVYIKNLPKE